MLLAASERCSHSRRSRRETSHRVSHQAMSGISHRRYTVMIGDVVSCRELAQEMQLLNRVSVSAARSASALCTL